MKRTAAILGLVGGVVALAIAIVGINDGLGDLAFIWHGMPDALSNLLAIFRWDADVGALTSLFFALSPILALIGAAVVGVRPGIGAALFILAALGLLGLFEPFFQPDPLASVTNLGVVVSFLATALAAILALSIVSAYERGKPARRHSIVVRATHWINVVCILVLLMSGLQIFNAHPGLYWGEISDFDNPMMRMFAMPGPDGTLQGKTWLFGTIYDTDGLFGASEVNGRVAQRGFPAWATLPSYQDLASGRLWHFLLAWVFVINGIVYLAWLLAGRHIRDLWPSGDQWRGFGRTIWDHLRLRFPKGEEARRYNILQKLTYLGLLLVLIVLVLAGLAMSPGVNAAVPFLSDVFGGRQSARTVHFICAALVLLFTLVHVLVVLVSGVRNNLRSMITGRYLIREERHGA